MNTESVAGRSLSWDSPLTNLRGVGKVRSRRLSEAGYDCVGDLLYHFPTRYLPVPETVSIGQLRPEMRARVTGRVVSISRARRGRATVTLQDGTGRVDAVWFNQPFRARMFDYGQQLTLTGNVTWYAGVPQLVHPSVESGAIRSEQKPEPVYSPVAGLTSRQLAPLLAQALVVAAEAVEVIPRAVRQRHGLPGIAEALRYIHTPDKVAQAELAARRFRFQELFILELALLWSRRQRREEQVGYAHMGGNELVRRFVAELPFNLTRAQERAWSQIHTDMSDPRPMYRLLQGDVGAGKTIVAVLALLKAVGSGTQGALMAPTELLAEQHYHKLSEYLGPLGVPVRLLTGSTPQGERDALHRDLQAGKPQVVIGTHALIQDRVRFQQLTLVITDEQHRFGVRQRAALSAKGHAPDILVMSATPIPRSLALTLFGDLDTSVIDELPPGRKPVRTYWRSSEKRLQVYDFVRQQLEKGRQAYIVCPLVEESANVEAAAVTEWTGRVRKLFGNLPVGMMHGRLTSSEKETTMRRFRRGELAALVSTTVIEVGIDVPNATLMVIEDADRFGLAQLHQLRGRIGRGKHRSYCILIAEIRQRTQGLSAST